MAKKGNGPSKKEFDDAKAHAQRFITEHLGEFDLGIEDLSRADRKAITDAVISCMFSAWANGWEYGRG